MMSNKTLQERLRNSVEFWHGHCALTMEAADALDAKDKRIAELEGQRDELAAVVREVADSHFDLSLHKQHDTLSYLKHNAQKALGKLDGDA